MNKSNVFVYIELPKLVAKLSTNIHLVKDALKAQASYFSIISPKYFSDALSLEWKNILLQIKQSGPLLDEDGNVIVNAITNSINQMSDLECIAITMNIISLHEKVKLEWD